MAINEWWASIPAERYWMETIRRSDFGDGIRAPFKNKNGAAAPYWELVDHVQDGDVVLHWTTERDGHPPQFAGWSRIDGVPYDVDNLVYNDNSPTSGREALLRDYTQFRTTVTIDDLNSRLSGIRAVETAVQANVDGLIYFPFAFFDNGTLRPKQGGYLTKFPSALFDVLPELNDAKLTDPGSAEDADEHTETSATTRSDRRQAREGGYISDPKVRRAIEMQAVSQAIQHYSSLGYRWRDVGSSKPYDLLLSGTGDLPIERHVEVKGSTGPATNVELTRGEVDHARTFQPTDLFVVSDITWHRSGDDVVTTSGTAMVIDGWAPADTDLKPIRFRHAVPAPLLKPVG
ncbi:hypothetical protein CH272_02660 [Rhodococcus sp. 05-340-1]|uniref:protein NO VEIN domain-containing protein n=1 Tax=unclassified Rhodococcus (in: high G+C Gram-positive bacteria) TaxID=192944 RepID=UPI000B9B9D55|nr:MULTISPECIES: DUF3883 domain-containing protein [unclassified Rhodococcus (in: high G+C Gram-positive bacteria)]OZD69947.1 hypothetical protein CH271_07955 [Rhodococcus sp. 05-340-2]OZD83323.1 hypothetical protein CH272_02660 [Rhodococcus sp. 05-340-1]